MILSYGDYAHPDNEANVSLSRVGLEAEDGFVYGYTETWNITGILHGDTNADLIKAMAELLDAYSLQGEDLIWKKGGDVMHQLLNDDTLTQSLISHSGLMMSIRIEGKSTRHQYVDVTVWGWNTPFNGITHLNGTMCSQYPKNR